MTFREILTSAGSKLWLCGMFSAGKRKNLQEVVDPIISNFNGVVATYHYPKDDDTDQYLESIKGEGEILYAKWSFRNDLSRNIYLWQGPMKNGDYFINIDENEELKPVFFDKLNDLLPMLIQNYVDGIVLHGKRFMYQYSDFLTHVGNPHEGIAGANRVVELTTIPGFENSEEYFTNLRPIRRDKFVFVDAYLRYYLSYPNSNHTLLGVENKQEEYKRREILRRKFRFFVQRTLNIETTTDALKEHIIKNGLSDELKWFINNLKPLNDFYRYHFLNDRNFEDDHDWKNVVKV
jgi:hypothetical protein